MKSGSRLRAAARPALRKAPAPAAAERRVPDPDDDDEIEPVRDRRSTLKAARRSIRTALKSDTLEKRLDAVIAARDRAITGPPPAVEGFLSVRVVGAPECPEEGALPVVPLIGVTVELGREEAAASVQTDDRGVAVLPLTEAGELVVRADSGEIVARRKLTGRDRQLLLSLGPTPAVTPHLNRGLRWQAARDRALVRKAELLKQADIAWRTQLSTLNAALKKTS